MDKLQTAVTAFAADPENAELNYDLGVLYENINLTAAAVSYYSRCSERTNDDNLAYECLLKVGLCFERQGDRGNTVRGVYKHAVCLLPKRPEAYFLLARYYERVNDHVSCYLYANLGLESADFNQKPLRNYVEYPGKYGLVFEKMVSSWWWGKADETRALLYVLKNEYGEVMNELHWNSVKQNIDRLGCKPAEPARALPERVEDSGLDFGAQPKVSIDYMYNEFANEGLYEKFCPVKDGDIVVDVGANVGLFPLSLRLKNPKHVYCIEPSNDMMLSLRKNTSRLLFPTTYLHYAITKVTGIKTVEETDWLYGDHGSLIFTTKSFKDFLSENKIKHIDFLKVDCEGGEYDIFTQENREFLRNNVDYIAGEWHLGGVGNGVEKFINFKNLYLKDTANFKVFEPYQLKRDITKDVLNDEYVQAYYDWWHPRGAGAQFMIYIDNRGLNT